MKTRSYLEKLMGKYLIVNADDFGICEEVNETIIAAHRQGIVTSTSLMVSGEGVEEAVKLAKNNPSLGVGLHLVLCCGKSILPPSQIPHLVDCSGNFPNNPTVAGLRYQFIAAAREELKLEIKAQLDRFIETGLPLSHIDGHLHLHCHPVVINILVELAKEYPIRFIRLPLEELHYTLRLDSSNLGLKALYANIFTLLRKYNERQLAGSGIRWLDRVYGLLQTGHMTESYLLGLLPQIKTTTNEIYFHPQRQDDREFAALCSQRVKDMLVSEGFTLVNYWQLGERGD
ncbi:MAG: hopanoid biosynthesis-associated protein HpnK [Geminocystis sp.]|nr:hopanoid biosynthesis-associated protein HpnK [Geminocystis sp.]MCS7148730.1 hopanoid biosynthesis-associated protein HpnK [Geminocystis sp.]MDW8116121.1 hopanoid biosynthesis-associated protein HpnK [Geminocystis sp.]MDW8463539.1 hopanoid biosynthesis-associated protein HpnK [Geminocystis sp.]